MPDPQAIYNHGDDRQRKNVGMIWPDLAAALEAARAGERQNRSTICAVGVHRPDPVNATGRMTLNGHPACPDCLKRSRRPGGYPLERQDPAKWKDS